MESQPFNLPKNRLLSAEYFYSMHKCLHRKNIVNIIHIPIYETARLARGTPRLFARFAAAQISCCPLNMAVSTAAAGFYLRFLQKTRVLGLIICRRFRIPPGDILLLELPIQILDR